jgi:serine protease Do
MKKLLRSRLPLIVSGLVVPLQAAPAAQQPPPTNIEVARQLNQAFVDVADKVTPAVVVINVVQKATVFTSDEESDDSTDSLPPEFQRRLPLPYEELPQEKAFGQGSGVIIREDGYILTNGHVVEDADKITVRLHDGRVFKGKVRGVDPKSDVAVIKIDAKGLPVAPLADSVKTRVGEFAIAIGAPFSLDYSVTYGHVSAKSRSNVIEGESGAVMDQDFIQTDANINPGNSGGPLVNINGEVIGINTLIRGLHTGIGFAIPSSLAKEISDKLISDGKFTRAWLGIGIRAYREYPEVQELLKGVHDGVVVLTLQTNGPAYKSDLRPKDVITAVDGKAISTPQDLRGEIRGKKIGTPVTLDVVRNGKPVQLKVKPAEWVETPIVPEIVRSNPPTDHERSGLGLMINALTREVAKQFGADVTEGVIVVSVDRGSLASRHGIRPGDIITEVNQKAVTSPKQFREALKTAKLEKGIILNIVSGKTAHFEVLKAGDE